MKQPPTSCEPPCLAAKPCTALLERAAWQHHCLGNMHSVMQSTVLIFIITSHSQCVSLTSVSLLSARTPSRDRCTSSAAVSSLCHTFKAPTRQGVLVTHNIIGAPLGVMIAWQGCIAAARVQSCGSGPHPRHQSLTQPWTDHNAGLALEYMIMSWLRSWF